MYYIHDVEVRVRLMSLDEVPTRDEVIDAIAAMHPFESRIIESETVSPTGIVDDVVRRVMSGDIGVCHTSESDVHRVLDVLRIRMREFESAYYELWSE